MGCSNCFNGCAEIISDQCVKYTGVDIPGLNIASGDPLSKVEDIILGYIQTFKNGTGILPEIAPELVCGYMGSFIPVTPEVNLNEIIGAVYEAVCDLNDRLTITETTLQQLNADYNIDCLDGVVPASDTHDVLQAAINKVCEIDNALSILGAELTANYVLITEIDSYIASYLSSLPSSSNYNARMVPYVAVPYFGPTVGIFDITGAGIGNFDKIYLCNGQNLTPDLRGRVLVGATTMGNTAFNPAVDPAIPGNPTYALNATAGANQAFLTSPLQLPPHSHSAVININDPQHSHGFTIIGGGDSHSNGNHSNKRNDRAESYTTDAAFTGITATATIGSTGASEGHNNIQPVHATNYIIYIP